MIYTITIVCYYYTYALPIPYHHMYFCTGISACAVCDGAAPYFRNQGKLSPALYYAWFIVYLYCTFIHVLPNYSCISYLL